MDLNQIIERRRQAEQIAADTNRTDEQRAEASRIAQRLAEIENSMQAQSPAQTQRPAQEVPQTFDARQTTGIAERGTALNNPFLDPIHRGSQQLLTGVTNLLPLGQGLRERGREMGLLAGPPENLGQAALQGAGESVPFLLAGAPALAARGVGAAAQMARPNTAVNRMVDAMAQGYQSSPFAFAGAELLAGTGAGAGAQAGRELAQESGRDEGTLSTIGAITGGVGAAFAPGQFIRQSGNLISRLGPDSQRRVQQSIQGQAQDVSLAEQNIARNLQDPSLEGITPARASEDPNLLALEQSVLRTDPALAATVEQRRLAAQARIEQEGRNLFGQTRNRTEWENEVFQFGAAPGAQIELSNTQDMLAQARQSFVPAYSGFRNEIVDENNLRTLGRDIKSAIENPDVTASKEARDTVASFVNSQLRPIAQRFTANEALTTGDLMDVRTAVRSEQRRNSGRTDTPSLQLLRTLDAVEDVLTGRIQEALGPRLADEMSLVDRQYRQYKVIEDAVFRSGEESLSPRTLSKAIQDAAQSRGQFAIGGDSEFRSLALTGHPVERLLADPETARRTMQELSANDINIVKSNTADHILTQAMARNEQGASFLSGPQLRASIDANEEGMRRLGFTATDLERMRDIARRMTLVQARPEGPTPELFDDSVAALTKIAASLVAVSGAGRLSDALSLRRVLGAGQLVIAQRFSSETNARLRNMTTEQARKLIAEASVNGDLYRSLLLNQNSTAQQVREGEAALNAWLAQEVGRAVERETENTIEAFEGMMP